MISNRWQSFALAACMLSLLCQSTLGADAANDAGAQEKKIQSLVLKLGADEFAQREQAQKELAKLGQAAFDALFDAQDHDDVEISLRAKYLLRLIRFTWTREDDSDAIKVILRDYDAVSERLRYVKMRELAELPNEEGIEALCRLARFEKSNKRSKYAALRIVRIELKDKKGDSKARADRINKSLGRSRRDAAGWLRAFAETSTKPVEAEKRWAALVAQEQKTLDLFPAETDRSLVATMMQYQVDLLEQLDRKDESIAVLRKMFDYIDVEREETLMAMVSWLARKRAWVVIDEVSKRFKRAFDTNALLLYALAEARLSQGDSDEAQKLADRAVKLQPGKGESSLRYHLIIAHRLQARDRLRWAESEFRHIIKLGASRSEAALMARSELAYMLHDLERQKEAADMLNELVKMMETDATVRRIVAAIYRNPAALKARMHYYYAQHHAADGKKDGQRKSLDEALTHDATDGDVLIDLYRLTKSDPEEHKKTQAKVKTAVGILLKKIAAEPNSATWYNQYAWLVANTEGDQEKALKMSLKSIKLRPESGGLLDTLAHCYFALKKYDEAVATQERAVKLEPSSRTIKKKLDMFRSARDEAKTGEKQS